MAGLNMTIQMERRKKKYNFAHILSFFFYSHKHKFNFKKQRKEITALPLVITTFGQNCKCTHHLSKWHWI